MRITIAPEIWPIAGSFRIARGSKTEAHVVVVTIKDGSYTGRGECVPYGRYNESVESVIVQLQSIAPAINTLTRENTQLPAGAARNALDCALLDFEAKKTGRPVYALLGLPAPVSLTCTFTLSLDAPDAMARAALAASQRGHSLLKLKIAGAGDLDRVAAVRDAAPHARLIVDANEGWSVSDLHTLTPQLAKLGVALIEQPLAEKDDAALEGFNSPVPLCADESCHTRVDLKRLAKRYAYINIKLDKTGGLTEAVAMAREAQNLGLRLMVGCMVATSLAMAPASLLGSLCDFVDLDGPLLLAKDRIEGLHYEGERFFPPSPALWG